MFTSTIGSLWLGATLAAGPGRATTPTRPVLVVLSAASTQTLADGPPAPPASSSTSSTRSSGDSTAHGSRIASQRSWRWSGPRFPSRRRREPAGRHDHAVLGAPRSDPLRAVSRIGARLRGVARVIETDVARSWTIAEVATDLGTSPRSLQRSLRNDGSTFSERLQRARLDVAVSLLRANRLSLTEIAFCSGFADQAHFSRVCRKRFDVPPTALKALLDAEP